MSDHEVSKFLESLRKKSAIEMAKHRRRRLKVKRKKRQFRGWSWASEDVNNNIMNNEKIFVGASDYSD